MNQVTGGRDSSPISGPRASAKLTILASASVAALLALAPPAQAQDATVEEVVVTASRLNVSGFTAPTPTTVIGTEDIARNAQPNVFTTIAQLPALQGSSGTTVGNGGTSGGTNGLSSFNMRGLGSIRTLTLLDGQRVVPANVTGVPDISEFPQLLIKRVDVVTGGASASYGSDAIAGVINFVTDRKFEGVKYNLLGGITTYGDGGNIAAQLALGKAFADGRGHVVASFEYANENGVGPNGFGVGQGPNGRHFYKAPQLQVRTIAATAPGTPQITRILNGQDYQYAAYGLITSGPLQGTAFGPGGQPFQFQYGSNGVPTGNGNVTNCVNPFCVGGDNSAAAGNGTSLSADLLRQVFYTAVSYNLTPSTEVFATLNVADVRSNSIPNPGARKNANLTIQCANPFVPPSVQAACTGNRITSFQFGTYNAEFPASITVNPDRKQVRFVLGADGSFDLLGKTWTWDTYFQHGENHTFISVKDVTLTPRYNAAINAVAGPNGAVVCSSVVARANGCVPLNVLGNVAVSPSTWAYLAPEAGAFQDTHQKQDAFSVAIHGTPFNDWAGPVAVAAGAEYRKESYTVRGDPYGNGVTATNANTAAYPADAMLNNATGDNWYAGNFHDGSGSYDVREAFAEVGVPLWNNEVLGKADLNIAGRATHYSTSGDVNTWKVGISYDTPIPGVRLRAVRSRDVRAPNLSELFAAPIVANSSVNNPVTGTAVTILNRSVGNPDLKPERGTTSEFGVVLQPTWLPGLSLSADYYKIQVDDAVSSLSAQQIVDLCFAGGGPICENVWLTGTPSNPNFVTVQSFNVASIVTNGFDFEGSYRFNLNHWNVPGDFSIRGLATNVRDFTTTTGIIGSTPIQSAGVNSGAIPHWKALGVQSWATDKWNLSLTERWFSDGVFNAEYIECATGCQAPTAQHPTIDDNKMKGAFYLDIGGQYTLTSAAIVYFKIDNLFDRDAAPMPSAAPNSIGVNPLLYDTLGRMYRVGIRGTF